MVRSILNECDRTV